MRAPTRGEEFKTYMIKGQILKDVASGDKKENRNTDVLLGNWVVKGNKSRKRKFYDLERKQNSKKKSKHT